jgi:tetratricopeptide (TPR) repeat protein
MSWLKAGLVLLLSQAALSSKGEDEDGVLEASYRRLVKGAHDFEGKGDFVKAQELYDAAAEMRPKKPDAFHLQAKMNRKLGQMQKAINSLQKAIAATPDPNGQAALYSEMAQMLKDVNMMDHAIASYEQALNLRMDIYDLNDLGLIYSAQGRVEDALRLFGHAVQLSPQAHAIWNNMGNVQHNQKMYAPAAKSYLKAHALDLHQPLYAYNLGSVRLDQQKYKEARDAMQKAVDIAPEFPEAHRKLGHLHDILGDPQSSVRHMKLAVHLTKVGF